MIQDYIAVVQAGGKGTRMEELTKNKIPKPMLLLNGRPMLEWQIVNMKKYGICNFIIIIGYLGDKIKEYFKDGSRLGVQIQYIEEKEPLGSAGSLFFLKPLVHTAHFFLVFGDIMFDFDLKRMVQFHEYYSGKATLLIHPNTHPYDSDLLVINEDNCVIDINFKYNKRNDWYENCVNAGIYILSSDILNHIYAVKKMDLEQDILLPLIKKGVVYGYHTPEYVKDAGTPKRFFKVSDEQKKGIWNKKNLEHKQVCVFVDRDGTINKYRGLIYSDEQFELEDEVAEAIHKLNESEFLVIVLTNQPVVARGMCGLEDVERIHKKMQVLLGENEAYVDDIIFCPHHPDKGYPEENSLYKITCNCRKPATGMIDEMAKKYNIDLKHSFIVGDSTTDIQTGKNAGLQTILVLTGQAGNDRKYNTVPDIIVKNLREAVSIILRDKPILEESI